jgi:flagellar hook protein FlgE
MMNVNASNVANVNTDGFIPKDTKMSNAEGSVSANIRSADDTGSQKSQTNLAKEIPDQIVASKAVAVNVSAIKTQDEMFGSLLDIKA